MNPHKFKKLPYFQLSYQKSLQCNKKIGWNKEYENYTEIIIFEIKKYNAV